MAAVEPALLPSAVRAAWQLQKWDQLDDLLMRCNKAQTTYEASRKASALGKRGTRDIPKPSLHAAMFEVLGGKTDGGDGRDNEKRSSLLRIHKDDSFELCMGHLMSCLHRGQKAGFDLALRDFRVEVRCSAPCFYTQLIRCDVHRQCPPWPLPAQNPIIEPTHF